MTTTADVIKALRLTPDAALYLDRRTNRILELRANGHTLKQVGRTLGISHTRIRQIENGAIHTLWVRKQRNTPQGFYEYERFGPFFE